MSKERRKPGRKAPLAPGGGESKARPTSPAGSKPERETGVRSRRYSHLLEEMVGCGDMVLLEPLSEQSLLENLRIRYENGEIYVRTEREREREREREMHSWTY